MRRYNARGRKGVLIRCPKCGYKWRVKNSNKPLICCSRCKRYFHKQRGVFIRR